MPLEPAPEPVGAAGPPLAHNPDHVAQALAARLQDYVGLPRFQALIEILAGQVQEIEDALWQIAEDDVDDAVGAQLEGFGSIVGAERQGLDDETYRALIRATIRANRSEGVTEDLYGIITAALADDSQGLARCYWYPPDGFILEILGPPAFDAEILHGLILCGTEAGTRAVTVVSSEPAGTRVRFSRAADFPTYSAATGYDSAATPGTGTGTLTRALDERTG